MLSNTETRELTTEHVQVVRLLTVGMLTVELIASHLGVSERHVLVLLRDLRACGFVELVDGDPRRCARPVIDRIAEEQAFGGHTAFAPLRRPIGEMVEQFGLPCEDCGELTDSVSNGRGLVLALAGEWVYVYGDQGCVGRVSSLSPHAVWMMLAETRLGRRWKRLSADGGESTANGVVEVLACAYDFEMDSRRFHAFSEGDSPEQWEAVMQAEDTTDG